MVARLIARPTNSAASASVNWPLPNPASIGDLLFIIAVQNTTGVASASGFTAGSAIQVGTGTNRATVLKAAAVSGTGSTVAVSGSATPTTVYVAGGEFSGVTTTEDATAGTAAAGAATSVGTGTVTTTTADCLLVAWLGTQTAIAAAATINNGFTIIGQTARACLAYKVVSATGAYSATWSWASSGQATGGIHAFRLATGIPRGDLSGFGI